MQRAPSARTVVTSIMPIVPYAQNGGGQVPFQGFLPSISATASISPSISPTGLPTYPPVAVYTSNAPDDTHETAPDASHHHTHPFCDSPIDHPSHESPLEQSSVSPTPPFGDVAHESDTQMKGKKPAVAAAGTLFSLFSFSRIYQNTLFEKLTPISERADEATWVQSSQSWVDRKVCNWFGFCGLAHLNKAGWTTEGKHQGPLINTTSDEINLSEFRKDAQTLPPDWSEKKLSDREIPDYVLEYAPYIHLYSGEEFWPGDIEEHLFHTTPHLNYTPLQATDDHPNLTNLNNLNRWGRFVYLQSDDNVEDRPAWLEGETNIPTAPKDGDENDSDTDQDDFDFVPDGDGKKQSWWSSGIGDTRERGGIRPDATASDGSIPTTLPEGEEWQSELVRRRLRGKRVSGGRSDAPAVLVVVPKDDGVVDAFWFFFYSYNLGNSVFNVRFGNHVGDWEHTLVRFQHGEPKAVFFSEHSFGEAYTWEAIRKIGKRPVGYSATGTHAMYASAGVHPYILPGGILHDVTDDGPLWDPTLNLYSYTYDYRHDNLQSSSISQKAPIGWFYFNGHWGDKFYPLNDPRQYRFLGQYHYVNGPLGPRFKNLGRQQVCQGNDECLLKRRIGDKRARRIKRFPDVGEGEEMDEENVRRLYGPE